MVKIIYAQTDINIEGKSIFLAGPTPRKESVTSWRPQAVFTLRKLGFNGTLLIPELEGGWNQEFAYKSQIEWEMDAMEKADIVLFWIPRELPDMPAFTTNTEFGYWIAKEPSKIRLGIPEWAVKCDYIKYLAGKNDIDVYATFTDLAKQCL